MITNECLIEKELSNLKRFDRSMTRLAIAIMVKQLRSIFHG